MDWSAIARKGVAFAGLGLAACTGGEPSSCQVLTRFACMELPGGAYVGADFQKACADLYAVIDGGTGLFQPTPCLRTNLAGTCTRNAGTVTETVEYDYLGGPLGARDFEALCSGVWRPP